MKVQTIFRRKKSVFNSVY